MPRRRRRRRWLGVCTTWDRLLTLWALPHDAACGIRRGKRPGQTDYEVLDLISIAGELKDHGGGHLDPKLTRLKTSESTADSQKEGVRISLFGGRHQLGSGGREQRAIIEMVCDRSLKGTEGEWSPQDDKYERVPPETEEAGGEDAAGRLRRADEGEVDRTEHQLLKGDANGTALVFDSYGPMADNGDVDVLRLTWRTEYACEGNSDAGSGGGGSEHWGFFTWVFFLWVSSTAITPCRRRANLAMMQRLPGHGGIPDFWIVAQLQPVRRAGMGPAAARRQHQGHPLPSEGLDEESVEHGAGNRVQGGLLGGLRGKEKGC